MLADSAKDTEVSRERVPVGHHLCAVCETQIRPVILDEGLIGSHKGAKSAKRLRPRRWFAAAIILISTRALPACVTSLRLRAFARGTLLRFRLAQPT